MSATYAQDGLFELDPALRVPFIVSIVFHITVVIALSIGLPFIAKDTLIISNPISVEIVDVSELTETNKPAPPKKPEPEKLSPPPEEKPSPPKVTSEAPPDLTKPVPPDIKEKVAEPREVEPPPPLERADTKKPKPKPKPKKPKVKPAPQKKVDDFQSLLKNLAPDVKEEHQEKTDPSAKTTSAEVSQIANLANRLTISEMDAVKRGLMPCWNIPIGSKDAQTHIVEIRVLMNPDRTVKQATIMNQSRYNRDSHFRAAAEAALRALRNPRCAPLQLPPNKYQEWKTIVIEFNPSDML